MPPKSNGRNSIARAFGPGNPETLDERGTMMVIGRLEAARRYPVKSLCAQALDSVCVTADGIPGDRESALFVRAGHAREGKTYRGKEHDRLHLLADADAAVEAAAGRGVDAVVRGGEHFFDDAPISLLVDHWLTELNEHLGYTVEWQRFRPNFFIRAASGFSEEENELVGSELTLGSVRLRVRCPIERCVAVTYHPRGEDDDPRILRFVAQRRNAWMGIYCDVLEPGSTRVGDSLIREAPLHS